MYHHPLAGKQFGNVRSGSFVGKAPDFDANAQASSRPEAKCVEDPIPDQLVCCGCLRAMTAGYVVCFLVLLEGILVSIQIIGIAPRAWWAVLSDHNPFMSVQWVVLMVLGIGDVFFALLGTFGLWMSRDASSVPRRFWSMQPTVVSWSVVLLVWWRLAVAFVAAPCVGVVLAFEPPGFSKAHAFRSTLMYVAVCVMFVYVLLMAYRQACIESALLRYQLDLLARADRKGHRHRLVGGDFHRFLEGGSSSFGVDSSILEEPALLCCLPLEGAVATYSFTFGGILLFCFVRVCITGQNIGGWAWMENVPTVDMMVPVEAVAYLFGGLLCLVGIVGVIYRHAAAGVTLAEADKVSKRSTGAVLVFFLGSVLRLSMFIPVTVMALVESDFCGVYLWGMASTNLSGRRTASSQLSCSQGDLLAALSLLFWALIDIFMVRAVCLLWQDYRRSRVHQAAQVGLTMPETLRKGPNAEYGPAFRYNAQTAWDETCRTTEVRL